MDIQKSCTKAISNAIKEHYIGLLDSLLKQHQDQVTPDAFSKACTKAKERFGRKLSNNTLTACQTALNINTGEKTFQPNKPVPIAQQPNIGCPLTPKGSTTDNIPVQGTGHPLSNFWTFPKALQYRGFYFFNGEQFFQFSKLQFLGLPKQAETLLLYKNPAAIKRQTGSILKSHMNDFIAARLTRWRNYNQFVVMQRLFNLKFNNFSDFRSELCRLGFFFHPTNSKFWGTGNTSTNIPMDTGLDRFGSLLMNFRYSKFGITIPLLPHSPPRLTATLSPPTPQTSAEAATVAADRAVNDIPTGAASATTTTSPHSRPMVADATRSVDTDASVATSGDDSRFLATPLAYQTVTLHPAGETSGVTGGAATGGASPTVPQSCTSLMDRTADAADGDSDDATANDAPLLPATPLR